MNASRINSLRQEVIRLNDQRARESTAESQATAKVLQLQSQIGRTQNENTIRSKLRDIDRHQKKAADSQKKRADIERRIAERSRELNRLEDQQRRAEAREQDRVRSELDDLRRVERQRQGFAARRFSAAYRPEAEAASAGGATEERFDAFISHASEDKESFVQPLADALVARDLRIWYDRFSLTVGDSLRESIDYGLARSAFGVVVLSEAFFVKDWPTRELNGLMARETNGGKVVLPIWHKVTKDEVLRHSPILADKLALSTANYTVEQIADQLSDVMRAAKG